MVLCSLWHSLKKESKNLIRIGSKKIAWFYKVVSTPWALNWYNSWDISVAATAQLTYYQQGLMRLLCFRAGHPALLHPAVITQWLQNATADGKTQSSRNSNCMLHQHMMCSDSQTNAGSANALSMLFLEELALHEYRRHHLPTEEPPPDSWSSINETTGSYIWCSGACTIKWRNSQKQPAQINCNRKNEFSTNPP